VSSEQIKKLMVVFLLVTIHLSIAATAYAEALERIVAIVNDDLILLSEFQEALKSAKEADSAASPEGILNDMIDDLLLLNEARKFRISAFDKSGKTASDNEAVIHEYIDRRIKALIHISYEDIERYYQMNRDGLYRDREINDVRDAIEEQLAEAELETKLREHIEELRKTAYIRIKLNEVN